MSKALAFSVAAATLFSLGNAVAAPPDVCRAFADYAMSSQSTYYAHGCPRVPQMNNGGSLGAQGHYNWCIVREVSVVQADRRKKGDLLSACLSGKLAQPRTNTGPDRGFCEAYGNEMTALWGDAKRRGCRAYMPRQNSFDMHFGWCMGKPRAVAQRGLDGNRRDARSCR